MTLLLSVTLAYAAGLLAGLREPVPVGVSGALCIAGVLALLARGVWQSAAAGGAHSTRGRGAAVALFLAAGLTVGSMRARDVAADCRAVLPDGARVTLTGVPLVVATEGVTLPLHVTVLRSGSSGAAKAPGDGATGDGGSAAYGGRGATGAGGGATIDRGGGSAGEGGGITCGDRVVRARASARHAAVLDSAVQHGTSIVVRGRWMAYPPRNGWPRKPEFAGGVLIDAVTAGDERAGALTRLRTTQQQRLRALLPERWGLAEALLLAQKAGLTPETRGRWVAAGLVHMLAISGMHVGLIAAGVILLCRLCGLPRRTGRRIALLITAAYVLFLGAPSAALRALLQASLLLAAVELQRPAEPFTALAAAALVILLVEPLAILDPGFQLSFAGMAGLIGWRRPIADVLPAALHPHIRDGLAAGIAASALTTPIAALHFGTASWIGIPASIVAVPVLACAVALLLVALVIAAVTGSTSGVHAHAADLSLRLLDRIATFAASIPGGHGFLAASTVMYALLAVAAAILVHGMVRRRDDGPPPTRATDVAHARFARRSVRHRLHLGIAAAAAVALLAWSPLVLRPHSDAIEIHAIDVGQGDAYATRTPAGRWLLVDTGPRTARGDAGRDRVVPYLLARGARRLDALILTHPDADHIGGAEAVLEAFDVGLVIDPGLPAGKDIFIDLLAAARHGGQRWVAAREGLDFTIDGVRVALLFPFADVGPTADANDNSVVFRLSFGTFAALFTGDAPTSVEEALVSRHGAALGSSVLKVGHHGSNTSTGDVLLAAVKPGLALVSAGRRNRYGHPAPRVLDRLERHEVRVLRTDQSGNFIVRAARGGRIDVLVR